MNDLEETNTEYSIYEELYVEYNIYLDYLEDQDKRTEDARFLSGFVNLFWSLYGHEILDTEHNNVGRLGGFRILNFGNTYYGNLGNGFFY